MRRDLYHNYPYYIDDVYNAYVEAIQNEPFKKKPHLESNLIAFDIGFSFKYNMNGGACHIHLDETDTGTSVQVRYSIVQLFGARCEAYDKALTEKVEEYLRNIPAIEPEPEPEFEQEIEPENEDIVCPNFCSNCGTQLQPDMNFCPTCGHKIK